MTTIAVDAKEGVMCSDSLWFDGDSCGPARKVFRVRGELIGLAGDLKECQAWIKAYRGKTFEAGSKLKNVEALRLHQGKITSWTPAEGWHDIDGSQFAIGTGAKAARAAMMAGASCKRAVQIAARIDAHTGGDIRQYRA